MKYLFPRLTLINISLDRSIEHPSPYFSLSSSVLHPSSIEAPSLKVPQSQIVEAVISLAGIEDTSEKRAEICKPSPVREEEDRIESLAARIWDSEPTLAATDLVFGGVRMRGWEVRGRGQRGSSPVGGGSPVRRHRRVEQGDDAMDLARQCPGSEVLPRFASATRSAEVSRSETRLVGGLAGMTCSVDSSKKIVTIVICGIVFEG